MNWAQLLINLGAAAAGGFATAVKTSPTGAFPTKEALIGAIVTAVIANAIGLFQQQPHVDPAKVGEKVDVFGGRPTGV